MTNIAFYEYAASFVRSVRNAAAWFVRSFLDGLAWILTFVIFVLVALGLFVAVAGVLIAGLFTGLPIILLGLIVLWIAPPESHKTFRAIFTDTEPDSAFSEEGNV